MGLQPDLRLSCISCFSSLKLTRRQTWQFNSRLKYKDHQTPKRQDIFGVELATNYRDKAGTEMLLVEATDTVDG